jgi:Protein of unknown function (DUF2997)
VSEEIEITVKPDGTVTVEAIGVVGSGCQQLTRAIEQALGTTTADQKKPEFMQTQQIKSGASAQIGR